MKLVKLGAAALNQTPLDWDANRDNILAAIDSARENGVTMLCLPELCICGYGCEDAFGSTGLRQYARKVLNEIVPHCHDIAVTVGLPVMLQSGLFNTVCLISDCQIQGFVAKQHLAGDGLHYEPRWFKPWPAGLQSDVTFDGKTYPIGDLIFDFQGVRVGFEICEDAWVAGRPGAEMASHGVDIILNPSASHFAFGKAEVRERFVLDGSRAFGVSYVYSNLLGNEAGRVIFDGGALIASGGKLLARGPHLGFKKHYLTSAAVDIDATRLARARSASFTPYVSDDHRIIKVDFDLIDTTIQSPAAELPPVKANEHHKEESFTRAITLGLFDYMRKSRSNGFVVSLSGGADSAAIACMVRLMIDIACHELGQEKFLDHISHTAIKAKNTNGITRQLLTTAYQGTHNSSQQTRQAAAGLADALGTIHYDFDVDDLVKGYTTMVESAIDRKLDWDNDDIALQNIQARVRAPGVWMLANLQNALLLSTSNRSEAAVGYATMDGDTCGGLSPIAGIDKAFLMQWLRWAELQGLQETGPIKALSAINQAKPTAELRPSDQHQTDEDDLMPYPILDAIEDAAIGQKKTPLEVLQTVGPQFTQYPKQQMTQWIERFFLLWSRNQWKRERYAPSFHVDDKNLDPKTWCRFPILSGGFGREIEELHHEKG